MGTGFGARVHVPALRAAGFDVVGLVGRDPDRTARRSARLGVPLALTDPGQALALDEVVAVTIATPPATHCALAIAAVRAGKHVICEKPFALDALEARRMAGAAAGVVALVGHEFRWATERAVTARAIASGAVGEPRVATFVEYVPLVADPRARVPRWWLDAHAGGGWLGASGSHAVDQVRVWLGEVSSLSATLTVASDRPVGVEDTFTVRARTRDGVDVVLQQTAAAWGPAAGTTRVAGTRGTVWLDGGVAWHADEEGSRPLPVPDALRLPEPPASEDPNERFTHLELGPYTRLCEALRAGIDGRSLDSGVPVPTFADGLECMRVLDAIRTSAHQGGIRVSL